MRVGLFVPCYIDAFEPQVGIATLDLLERLGVEVDYPLNQTCCGQPMANTGCHAESAATEQLFVRNFAQYDTIVAPSGSCVHHVRAHLTAIEQTDAVRHVRTHTFDLVEFLHDVLCIQSLPWARFPHRVAYHSNCQALRGLEHARASELNAADYSKPLDLLAMVAGIDIVTATRPDECCGFGGSFSVAEQAVSVRMGTDKVGDFAQAGAEYVVSADSSCLMHQQGCAARLGLSLKFIHIAQVLNGAAS